jgi:hypothetical protein
MTDPQHALILKHQANTPSIYHHIINHLVLTEQYAAASMLVATLEREVSKKVQCKNLLDIKDYQLQLSQSTVKDLYVERDKLEREMYLDKMQAEGFRVRMEQLLTENADLKAELLDSDVHFSVDITIN